MNGNNDDNAPSYTCQDCARLLMYGDIHRLMIAHFQRTCRDVQGCIRAAHGVGHRMPHSCNECGWNGRKLVNDLIERKGEK